MDTNPGVWARIMDWLRGNKQAEGGGEGGQGMDEGMFNPTGDVDQGRRLNTLDTVNAVLPEAVSGRGAVLAQRKKMRDIDDMLDQANR